MNNNEKRWTEKFNVSDKDTCHGEWNFNLKKIHGSIIIESIEIINSNRGCQGHPKTISALVQNIPIENLDLDTLAKADCVHEASCGMVLAKCVEKLKMQRRKILRLYDLF